MVPQIYDAIEEAVASGVPPQNVASLLISAGWPPSLVNQTVSGWMDSHGRTQSKTGFSKWLAKYKKRAISSVIIIVSVSVISSAIALLRPWPTKIMVDSAFGNIPAPGSLRIYTHTPKLILITSLMTVVIFIIGAISSFLRDYLVLRLGFRLNRDIKEETLQHILHLPLFHQTRLSKGDYVYRQNTLTNSLSDLVLDTTSSILQSVIMIIGILIIMLTFNVGLTLISVVLIPFLFILTKVYGPKLGRISRLLAQNTSKISSIITEAVDNAEVVQAYNLEEKELAKANQVWMQNHSLARKGLMWSRTYRFSNSILIIIATSAVMYLGGTAALDHKITLGELLIFMTYMGYLLAPVENLANQISSRGQKKADVSRVYEVLSDYEGIESMRSDRHLMVRNGKIEFRGVSYAYDNAPVLNGLNFVVEPGKKIGIIGPSGSGKSTLLKLLPLFVEPSRGQILIDDIDIQAVSLKELRQNIAWISQNPQLFNESLVENLTDADVSRTFSAQEIDSAINAADVTEFARRLPLKLNTLAGEDGSNLSGGQRQRVAIARGLIKNARIVLMDEPTAALDSKSENNVKNSLRHMLEHKTVLLVTHRRALLELMDIIYVLENGQLVPVEQFGGLERYLERIHDLEDANPVEAAQEEAQLANKIRHDELQKRLIELESHNNQLQQKLDSKSFSAEPDDEGTTIRIAH